MARPAARPYRLTDVAARRVLRFLPKGGAARQVVVRLGKPRRGRPGDDWVCPYEITGMPSVRRRWAHGIDAFQALGLALHILPAELAAIAKRAGGGTFAFLGDDTLPLVEGCALMRQTRVTLAPYAEEAPQRARPRAKR